MRRRDTGPDTRLDELLEYEEPTPDRAPARRVPPWMARASWHAIAASAVLYALLRLFNYDPPYPLLLAVCAGAVLVRHAVFVTAEPSDRPTRAIVGSPGRSGSAGPRGWGSQRDGMLDAVRRWDRRLDWGSSAPERFDRTVRGRLGELADERLRQRHGITRASDPARARAILGEATWHLLHDRSTRVPKPRDVAVVATTLEGL